MNENEPKRGIPEKVLVWIAGLILLSACGLFCVYALTGKKEAAKPFASPAPSPSASAEYLQPVSCYFPPVSGSCALIVSAHGENTLIDAGYETDAPAVTALLEELGAERLDYVFLTAGEEWAYGGMAAVAERFPVGTLVVSDVAAEEAETAALLAALEKKGTEVRRVRADFVSTFDAVADGELRLLSPYEANYGSGAESALVLRLSYGESRILFLSEAGALAERMMIKALPNKLLHTQVLYAVETGSSEKHLEKFFKVSSPYLSLCRTLPGAGAGALTEMLGGYGFSALDGTGTVHLVLDGQTVTVVE